MDILFENEIFSEPQTPRYPNFTRRNKSAECLIFKNNFPVILLRTVFYSSKNIIHKKCLSGNYTFLIIALIILSYLEHAVRLF